MGWRLSTACFALLSMGFLQLGRPEAVSQERTLSRASDPTSTINVALQARRKRGRRHSELNIGESMQPTLAIAQDGGPLGDHPEASDGYFSDDWHVGARHDANASDSPQPAEARDELKKTELEEDMPSFDVGERLMGFLCVLVACIGFGSNFIPVKMVDIRDGMFFTLCMVVGIFVVGFVQWQARECYRFEPFAMLGGAIWATGNLFVPFIVKRTGLGVGQLVWGATNMLTGWATGTFGLFGKEVDVVADPRLNHFGVMVSILSLVIFTQMKPESGEQKQRKDVEMQIARSETSSQFITGFVVAICCGVLFGSNFDPPTYLQQLGMKAKAQGRTPVHSPDAMDYVLSHFAGILLTTILAFVGYNIVFPSCYVSKSVILPGLASGLAWGVAQMCWFKANSALSYVIAFPIIVAVPGIIAALWGVVLFGENSGFRNLSLLAVVIVAQAVSVSMIAISKDGLQSVLRYY